MIWLGLGVAGVALTIIGLMPGSIYDDRQGLVALVVAGFGVMVGVDFLKSRAERVPRTRRAERRYAGWQLSLDRRLDLRQRGRNRARRIGSRRVSRTAPSLDGKPEAPGRCASRAGTAQGRPETVERESASRAD